MKRLIISIVLAICAGCSTYKSEESKVDSRKDIVSVTISLDGDQYHAEAEWVETKPGGAENLIAKAGSTSLLDHWACVKALDTSTDYRSRVMTLLDNEVVEVDNGYGTTLGIFAKQQDGGIYAKGIFVATAKNQAVSCSFEGFFIPGEPQVVYARSEFRGEDSVEPITQGPFQPITGGTPLFK